MQSRITLDDISEDLLRQIVAHLFMDSKLFLASQSEDVQMAAKATAVATLRAAVDNPDVLNLVQDFDEAIQQFFSEE